MKNKKIILTLIILLLFAAGSLFGYSKSLKPTDQNDVTTNVNYGSPTKTERKYSADNKQKVEDKEKRQKEGSERGSNNSVQNNTGVINKKDTAVIITDASQYGESIEVRAFMPDAYEDGTCTIIIKKGNNEIKKRASAYKDISTTICTNPTIKRSEFPSAGDWTVIVSYDSASYKGASKPQTIKIE